MKHNLVNFEPNTEKEGDWHEAFCQAQDHMEAIKKELENKLAEINVEQKQNNELLNKGTPIANTTTFYNNGQYRIIEELLGKTDDF